MKEKLHPFYGDASTLNAGDRVTMFTKKELQEMEEIIYDKSCGYSCKTKEAPIFIGDMVNSICGKRFTVRSKPNDESWFFNSNSCEYFIPIWAIKKIKKSKGGKICNNVTALKIFESLKFHLTIQK